MKLKAFIIIIFILIIVRACFSQVNNFKGHSGVYFLGAANIPVSESNYSRDNISGVVIRIRWESLETLPGFFDWSFIDSELEKAKTYNKKCLMEILGKPDWLADSLGAMTYGYIDKNQYHPTYGDTLFDYITWDSIYLSRIESLINNLGEKYSGDTTISYWNMVSGQISRNLPDSVVTSEGYKFFPEYFNYQPDTLIKHMNRILDVYMQNFPNTPMWASMDYQRFEPAATGNQRNYVAQKFAEYGISEYPESFGVWREDLSACNPNLQYLQTGSPWYIVKQNPCRNGAQMVWSVKDGPTRMNQCGIIPNTKENVLASAVNHGIELGMKYIEIYGADINDPSLQDVITEANNALKQQGNSCDDNVSSTSVTLRNNFNIYPNPSNGNFRIKLKEANFISIKVFNASGQLIQVKKMETNSSEYDIDGLSKGVYNLLIQTDQNVTSTKIIVR